MAQGAYALARRAQFGLVLCLNVGAQGAEMQFEGGTGDPNFKSCMDGLLSKLKAQGFTTAIGPFFSPWGTGNDYSHLSGANIDIVNFQMYVNAWQGADALRADVDKALQLTPGGVSKYVFGLNSAAPPNNRGAAPSDGLAFVQSYLVSMGVAGMFSWDAEGARATSPAARHRAAVLCSRARDGMCADCSWTCCHASALARVFLQTMSC